MSFLDELDKYEEAGSTHLTSDTAKAAVRGESAQLQGKRSSFLDELEQFDPDTVEQPVVGKKDEGVTLGDVGKTFAKGAVGAVGGTYGLVNTLTGGVLDTAAEAVGGQAPTKTFKQWDESFADSMSDAAKAERAKLSPEDTFFESFKTVLTNPKLAGLMAIETAPHLMTVIGGSAVAAARAAQGLVGNAARVAAEKAATRAALGINTGLEAGSTAQDVRADLLTASEDDLMRSPQYRKFLSEYGETPEGRKLARERLANEAAPLALAISGAVSAASSVLTGTPQIAGAVARMGLRLPVTGGTVAKTGVKEYAKEFGKGALKEAAQETLESGGSQLAANVGKEVATEGQVTAEKAMEGVASAAGSGAALGAVMGGVTGGLSTKVARADRGIRDKYDDYEVRKPVAEEATVASTGGTTAIEQAVGEGTAVSSIEAPLDVQQTPPAVETTVQPTVEPTVKGSVGSTVEPDELNLRLSDDAAEQLPEGSTPNNSREVVIPEVGSRYISFEDDIHAELFDLGVQMRKMVTAEASSAQKTEIINAINQKAASLADAMNLTTEQVRNYAMLYRNSAMRGASETTEGAYKAPNPTAMSPLLTYAVEQISKGFKLSPDERLVMYEIKGNPKLDALGAGIKKAFGTDVVFASFGNNRVLKTNKGTEIGGFRGFRLPGKDAILIDPTDKALLTTVTHELTHVMETKHPELYAKLAEVVKSKANPEAAQKLKGFLTERVKSESGAKLPESLYEKELVAETIEDLGADQKLWSDIFEGMGDKTVAKQLFDLVNEFISKALEVLQGPKYVNDRKDLLAVRKAAAEAFSQWVVKEQGNAVQKQGADEGRVQRGTRTGDEVKGKAVGKGDAKSKGAPTKGEKAKEKVAPKKKADKKEGEKVTVVDKKRMRPGEPEAYWRFKFSNGKTLDLIKLDSTESMGVPGWHDNRKVGKSMGNVPMPSYLGDTIEQAIAEHLRVQAQAARLVTPSGEFNVADDLGHQRVMQLVTKKYFDATVDADPIGLRDQYIDMIASDPGFAQSPRTVNTDEARKLDPFYNAFPADLAPAVHSASSKIAKMAYAKYLADADPAKDSVLIMAGGGGSGKGTIQEKMKLSDLNTIVYDGVMGDVDGTITKIRQAQDAGLKVRMVYVNTPAMKALAGAMNRALRIGRIVPLSVLAEAHKGASDTIREIVNGNLAPDVEISIYNNDFDNPPALGNVEDVYTYSVESLKAQFENRLKEAVANEEYPVPLARAFWPEGPWDEDGLRRIRSEFSGRPTRADTAPADRQAGEEGQPVPVRQAGQGVPGTPEEGVPGGQEGGAGNDVTGVQEGGEPVEFARAPTQGQIRTRDTQPVLTKADPFEVSTRFPSGPTSIEDPNTGLLTIGIETVLADDAVVGNFVNLIRDYTNFKPINKPESPREAIERFIGHMEENLLWLYNNVPEKIRNRSKLWYDGGRKLSERYAQQHGLTVQQSAGVFAVLSPKLDWFKNVALGIRVMDIMRNQQDTAWSNEMDQIAERIYKNEAYQLIRGRKLSELTDPASKADWIRAYDEAHNEKTYEIVTPEGEFAGLARSKYGKPTALTWQSNSAIAKAVRIIEDGSFESISNNLGAAHKVRNFYNNLLVPGSANGHVTIDTHAVAAALLQPFSQNDTPVAHNFGGKGSVDEPFGPTNSSVTGLQGTYALYAEATRRAAKKVGILPREMQSITWEAVRGLFEAKNKKGLKAPINAIWQEYKDGKLTAKQARQKILARASGIADPAWASGPGPATDAGQQLATDAGGVPQSRVSRKGSGQGAARPGGVAASPVAAEGELLFSREAVEQAINSQNDRPIVFPDVPTAAMKAVGISEIPLIIKGSTVRKIATGKGGQRAVMNAAQIAALPKLIGDPLAIFESSTRPEDSLVFVLNVKLNGAPVVASVEKNAQQRFEVTSLSTKKTRMMDLPANEITSAYPKNDDGSIASWLKSGKLRYWDKNKVAQTLPGLAVQFREGVRHAGRQGSTVHDPSTLEEPEVYASRVWYDNLTPDQEAALRKVGAFREPPTLKQQFEKYRTVAGQKVLQGTFDQFAAIKALDPIAYMKARMSKASDGTLEATMLYGKPFMSNGVPDVDINDEGFIKVLASLKGEHQRFLQWVAAHRAENLKRVGLENLYDTSDINALKTLNQGNFPDGTPRAQVYNDALTKLNRFNESILKIALESDLIDQRGYDIMRVMPYVPFFRVKEETEDGVTGPRYSSGLVNQKAWQKLKGGTAELNADLLSNVLKNWAHVFDAAAKNRAAVATMQAAVPLGSAVQVSGAGKDVVRVMEGGQTKYYEILDPHLHEAISALNYVTPSFFKPFQVMKHWLTWGVTANPTFKIRNLIRDLISATAMTSELSANPLENFAKGISGTSQKSQTYASMLAGGGVIKFGTIYDSNRSERANRMVEKAGGVLLNETGWHKLKNSLEALYDTYQEFGDRGENVNRVALYRALKEKGYSDLEANFMARDLMDFSLQGRWPIVRFLAETVPFLNARLQGLYRLGRAGKEDTARFGYVVGSVALASVALAAMYADDDDWKKREDWDRDTYWWFKIGDTAFRIPKPFEVGSIGSVAERVFELFTSDEMTGKRFMQSLAFHGANTFSFNPTPQLIKPMIELWANKDFFTQRQIETEGLRRLSPEQRYNVNTTETAKLLSAIGLPDPLSLAKFEYKQLSPVQIDHLLKAYFGWVGSRGAMVVDAAVRPLLDKGERPDMRLKDLFVVGNFVESLPSGSSRYVSQLYEQAEDIEQAYASWRNALKMGRTEEAKELFEENKDKIRKYKFVERVKRQQTEINGQIRKIQASKELSGAEKRARINALELRKDKIARRVSVE